VVCGDGDCDAGEDCNSCPGDCGVCAAVCGDSDCDGAAGENCTNCAPDCGACPVVCGDGTCDIAEDCSSCPGDCGACAPSCGDGSCNGIENCSSCPGDCGACTTVTASLSANPSMGPVPLLSTLTATVGGTDVSPTINYSFWWDCNNSTNNVALAEAACGNLPNPPAGNCATNSNGAKCEAVGNLSQSLNHTYDIIGNFRSKVIIERGLATPDEDRVAVSTNCTAACNLWGPCTNPFGPQCGSGREICNDANSCLFNNFRFCLLPPCPDFGLNKSNDIELITVRGGGTSDSTHTTITVTPFNGFSSNVRLEVVNQGVIPGATYHFDDDNLNSGEYFSGTDFYVVVPNNISSGDYYILIRGRGNDPLVGWIQRDQFLLINIKVKDPNIIEF